MLITLALRLGAFALIHAVHAESTNRTLLPPISTTSGKVQGYLDDSTTSTPLQKWYGIRFAQDTSGQNRWRPPQPFKEANPDTVFNATQFGPACMQGRADGGNGTSVQSEDCLRINVISPDGANNLPVYVYS